MGTLEQDRIELAADSAEPIIRIDVTEGDRVTAGQTLAEQDTARLQAELAAATAEASEVEATLAEALAGPRQEEITRARSALAAATATLRTARLQLEREQSLGKQDFASQNTIDLLTGDYEGAIAHQAQAQALLDEMLAGSRPERIAQLRARRMAAAARVDVLQVSRDRAILKAPVAGVIEALPLQIGERPQPGQAVVIIRAESTVFARVHLPEAMRASVQLGTEAWIRVDGRAQPYPGRVRWISTTAAFTPYYALTQHDRSRLSYLAEVELLPADDWLPIGLPVEVTFRDSPP